MGYFIDVNYAEFEKAAQSIEAYVAEQKRKMREADQVVEGLGADWQGEDYNQFRSGWGSLDDSGSTTMELQKVLGDYADTLRYVAELYKNAQKNAIARANNL